MSATIIGWAVMAAQLMLGVSMVLASWRIIRGPRAQDRVLALDSLYVLGMLLLVTFGVGSGSALYFEVALVIGALSFVATVALAKFLMRGEVIE
jgi:multicomponent K+:H+ antiporter subunit F